MLVYHEHCYHVLDIQVFCFVQYKLCLIPPQAYQYSDITFGDVSEILTVMDHSQDWHEETQLLSGTADMVDKVNTTFSTGKRDLSHCQFHLQINIETVMGDVFDYTSQIPVLANVILSKIPKSISIFCDLGTS